MRKTLTLFVKKLDKGFVIEHYRNALKAAFFIGIQREAYTTCDETLKAIETLLEKLETK